MPWNKYQFWVFAAVAIVGFWLLTVLTGCGGHATALGTRAGVYLSTTNAWAQVTVMRLAPTGAIVGNTYSSLDDAQGAIASDYQPGTGNYTGSLVGTLTCTDPSAPTTCTMALKITEQNGRSINVTSPSQFMLDGLDELSPIAIWTEVA